MAVKSLWVSIFYVVSILFTFSASAFHMHLAYISDEDIREDFRPSKKKRFCWYMNMISWDYHNVNRSQHLPLPACLYSYQSSSNWRWETNRWLAILPILLWRDGLSFIVFSIVIRTQNYKTAFCAWQLSLHRTKWCYFFFKRLILCKKKKKLLCSHLSWSEVT